MNKIIGKTAFAVGPQSRSYVGGGGVRAHVLDLLFPDGKFRAPSLVVLAIAAARVGPAIWTEERMERRQSFIAAFPVHLERRSTHIDHIGCDEIGLDAVSDKFATDIFIAAGGGINFGVNAYSRYSLSTNPRSGLPRRCQGMRTLWFG